MIQSSGVMMWAYTVLSTDPTTLILVTEVLPSELTRINIFEASLVPQGVTADYITMHFQSSPVERGTAITGQRGMSTSLLTIKAMARSASFGRSDAILSAVRSALELQSGSAGGVEVVSCLLEGEIPRQPEITKEGETYPSLGLMFRIWAKES